MLAVPARADLYSAHLAYQKGDFESALHMFRELAELGQPRAQLDLAIMYTRGEGAPKNLTLAYAWSSLAAESSEPRARGLADEIRPLLSADSLQEAEAIRVQYGRPALDARLMPKVSDPPAAAGEGCRLKRADTSVYPAAALNRGINGFVYAEYTIMPDGRARHARILLAVPADLFDEAVRTSIRRSTFEPAIVDGKRLPCMNGVFYRFQTRADLKASDLKGLNAAVKEHKARAEAGEVASQIVYGMMIAGVPQLGAQRSEAVPWFLKAAQAGAPLAQYQVGTSLLLGWGCACEPNKALFWLRKAAESDQADAQVTLASYALRGELSETNLERAKVWLERAAAQGHRDAKTYLAALLAAAPSGKIRDPARALAVLDEVFVRIDDDPVAFEIRAAAAAAMGDFAAAARDQARAVRMAKKLGWDLAPHAQRQARYEAGQPWYGDLLGMAGTVAPL